MIDSPLPSAMQAAPYRVGRRVPRNVYFQHEPLFVAASEEQARQHVEVMNAGYEALAKAASLETEIEGLRAIVAADDAKALAEYEWERANNLTAERDEARSLAGIAGDERDTLAIAIEILLDSGHGGAMAEVRAWIEGGGRGGLPWPGGAIFCAWAAERGIRNVKGFATRPSGPTTGGGV